MKKLLQQIKKARKSVLPNRHGNTAGRGILFAFLWTCAFMAVFTPTALAQSITGDIVATVTDPSGAVIPKVVLVLTGVDTGQETKLESNGSGLAVFSYLKPGLYKMQATMPDSKPQC